MPIALCAMGALALVLSGCGKKEEAPEKPLPPNSPQVYMNDPVFRKQIADERKALQAIVSERAPLVARMEELVRSNHEDKAALEKLPEWNELYAKVVALNAKYEETRQRQLKIVRERVAPQVNEKISK